MFIYVNVYIKNNFNLVIFLINVFKCFGKKKIKIYDLFNRVEF